jgi:hypothetical protein
VLLIKTSAFCWNNNCVIINMHGTTTIKIVKIQVNRADGTFQMCSRCGCVKTVVWGQRNTRVDPTHATCIDRIPLRMIAFINYVPYRKLTSTETNMLVMFREIAAACCVITGFHHIGDRNCAVLGYYAAGSGSSLPAFRDSLSAMFREIAAACCLLLGFRREVNRNCVLLGYYPAGGGNSCRRFGTARRSQLQPWRGDR